MSQQPWDPASGPVARPQSPTSYNTVPGPPAAEWAWRVRHSAWILAPVLSIGLLSFVGFGYCALRIRERRWAALTAISFATSAVGWAVTANWTTPSGDLTAGATVYLLGLWLGSVVFALLVAPDYLRWRAGRPITR